MSGRQAGGGNEIMVTVYSAHSEVNAESATSASAVQSPAGGRPSAGTAAELVCVADAVDDAPTVAVAVVVEGGTAALDDAKVPFSAEEVGVAAAADEDEAPVLSTRRLLDVGAASAFARL